MKKYAPIISLFAILLLAACSGGATSTSGTPSALPAVTDPDQVIEVRVGEEFTITLETNPNAGLHWEVAVELDETILDLSQIRKEFVPDSEREGSAGRDVWTFVAIAPGETTITLGYYRGATENSVKTAVFKIIVR
ncbi:MAG: hypothetical protein HFACDABA_02971 [Anaerolineales bacterium]|nr:hypothetical protein [Anaerolineales bacterium]